MLEVELPKKAKASLDVLQAAARAALPRPYQAQVLNVLTKTLDESSAAMFSLGRSRIPLARRSRAKEIVEDLLENPHLDQVLVSSALSQCLNLISETASSPLISPLLAEVLISLWERVQPSSISSTFFTDARVILAANPAAPPSVLARLASVKISNQAEIFRVLAGNPSTPRFAFSNMVMSSLPRSTLIALLAGLPPDLAAEALAYKGEMGFGAWMVSKGAASAEEMRISRAAQVELDALSTASLRLTRSRSNAERLVRLLPEVPPFLMPALKDATERSVRAFDVAKAVHDALLGTQTEGLKTSSDDAHSLLGAALTDFEELVGALAQWVVSSQRGAPDPEPAEILRARAQAAADLGSLSGF